MPVDFIKNWTHYQTIELTGNVNQIIEPVREKTNNLGFDQVRHKLGCTVTEDGFRMENLDLESRGIVLSV